ncbi:hypothetical protein [Saccharolobus shibatae]|uniref:Uncharacterized protein n=1 Tax=Saccharolobus shibatae TaxID=2286 RepID=A0A8F5BS44_9CREN|nr:hypothetical protein [Saccharolobus shibatae]QXJ30338.1 hypothetical protein J5U21_p0080 [Saccharolobus shibatae]QXJ30440.1 hypothetical protein J5U21_00080 [Saccharolobus shibatae]
MVKYTKVISARVDDWIAEQVEKLGKPSDVLRDAIIAYISNKLGICEDMAMAQWKIMAFREVFSEAVNIYRKYSDIFDEMSSLVFSTSKPFDTKKFIELESNAKKFFIDYELGKYLDLIVEFLKVLKMNKDPYREFDLTLEKVIKEFEDAKNDYIYIKNSLYLMGMTDSWLYLIESIFRNLPLEGVEKVKEETVRKAIELRSNVFSFMDIRKAIEFIDFTENYHEGPMEILRQICRGQRSDFQIPTEVCSIYNHIVSNKLYSQYLASVADIAEKYGMNRQEAMEKVKPIILGEGDMYYGFDTNVSKGALEPAVLDKFRLSMFDLSVKSPELLFSAKLFIDLEKVRKKICTP